MGNRAVITTSKALDVQSSSDIGVYLHWNGGRDSVEAFLRYCELKEYRAPDNDNYGWARLCQVIGNFFGGTTSIGIDKCCNLDCNNCDNGVYIISGWEIVDRQYGPSFEQDNHDLLEMLLEIDKSQPKSEQLGEEFLMAKEIDVSKLAIGDTVFMHTYDGQYKKLKVHGFGATNINGYQTNNVPYVALYGDEEQGYAWNCNNYIRTKTIRVAS